MGVVVRPLTGERRRPDFGLTLRDGVSIAALCAIAAVLPVKAQQSASGQDAPDTLVAQASGDSAVQSESLEEIIVTGFRRSLESAQDLKRYSESIVDSVTAEDIGALPDRSVTEALQRIPGVTINRFAAGIDPDHFSVEGSGVVVRGLTYVRSEFNGREAFSANNGRALGFADVPSELMGGVDVYKSPTADRIEGGIAGVVNLRTRKPFDSKGTVMAASAEASYGDFVKKAAPTGSILLSDRWETGAGEFGLLGSFVGSQLKTRADRFQLSSFRVRNLYSDGDVVQNGSEEAPNAITDQVLFPRGAVVGSQEFDRRRYGYAGAAQWRSPDNRMEAVFTFLRSDARQAWTEHAVEIATDNVANNGDSRRVPGTELKFSSSGMFESGLITGPNGWRDDQRTEDAWGNPVVPRITEYGLQSNNIRRDHEEKLVTNDYGLNFRWDVTDNLGLNFDYQHVKSSSWIIDNGLWTSSYQNVLIDMNGGKGYPRVEFQPPQVCSGPSANWACSGVPGSTGSPTYFGEGHNSFADPYNTFYRSAMDHIEDSTGNSDAVRIDADYKFEDSNFLKSVQVGYRYADRQQTARFSTYNWGRLSEQWGNNGPVWLDDPLDGNPQTNAVGTPATAYQSYKYPNFFRGKFPDPLLGQGRLFYSGNSAKNYADYIAFANSINREWEPTVTGEDGVVRNGGWNSLADRAGVVAGTPFLPGEINPIREENNAGYILAKFDGDMSNGWKFSGNVGVRYTTTDRTSDGFLAFPTPSSAFPTDQNCLESQQQIEETGEGALPAFCTFSPEVRQQARNYTNNALIPSRVKINYDHWLPNLNLKLAVSDELQFRAAYFKGVAPPATGLTRNYFNVNLETVQNVNSDGSAIPGSYRLQGTFNAGNPFLRPTTADNYDLTAEWYFANVGQLTASLFYKELKGVLTNDVRRYSLTNNGATFDSVVTTPVNADEIGKIKGLELAYQQTYDFLPGIWGGFGLQANYTYVHSKGVPQSTLSETDPDVGAGRVTTVDMTKLPLQGLSKHSFNITPFYEYGPISARISYSWRSDFLLTIRDVIFPYDPIVNEATGQWDASLFYSFNDNLKFGLQGANLLNEVTKTSAVVTGPDGENVKVPRGWYMNDRRITAVARFTY
ncbi:TonB-dependent receptor [Niveispirillum fermenti]|uniref:TonB-dependent receptor n=1 Tax=Niveispirillum fermenti TaxID=1233113 RepID=UPI003A84027E